MLTYIGDPNLKNLYEFDLKGCFENIKINPCLNYLLSNRIPKHLVDELHYLNHSTPRLPMIEELDESKIYAKREYNKLTEFLQKEMKFMTFTDLSLLKQLNKR